MPRPPPARLQHGLWGCAGSGSPRENGKVKEVWLREVSAPQLLLMTAERPVPNPMAACLGEKATQGQEGAAGRSWQAGCRGLAPGHSHSLSPPSSHDVRQRLRGSGLQWGPGHLLHPRVAEGARL